MTWDISQYNVDILNFRTSNLWLGASEVAASTWNWTHGSYVAWSLWRNASQVLSELGCMALNGSTRRMSKEPCDSTDITGFFCRKTGRFS